MKSDWRAYAEHILAGIELVWDFHARIESGAAPQDMGFHAINRILETICEAASDKLPRNIKERYPEINWKAIAGMRVRLAHAYLSIDPIAVDVTITRDLAELYRAMKTEIPDWDARKER